MNQKLPFISMALGLALSMPSVCGSDAIQLALVRTPQESRLEWQGPIGYYAVQSTPSLTGTNWKQLSWTRENQLILPSSAQQEFYRLVYYPPDRVTRFSGGSLDDLKILSPALEFDILLVDGPLKMALWDHAQLSVHHLWLDRSGSIGYVHSDCEHGDAPSLTIHASGDVELLGEVLLIGESGNRVTSSAACNSATARDGGNLEIFARTIRCASRIDLSGGAGGTIVNSVTGSIGQQGADGGRLLFEAAGLEFKGARVRTYGGSGGFGGDGGTAADGSPGKISLLSEETRATQSQIETDGTFSLTANRTSIVSPITATQKIWNWNGITADTQGPVVHVLQPSEGSSVLLESPTKILISVEDALSGVSEIEIEGLGLNARHFATQNLAEFEVAYPAPPQWLKVTVWDNSGNSTAVVVDPLPLVGNLYVPDGITYPFSSRLNLGPTASVRIAGDFVLPRGQSSYLHCGTFYLEESGRIRIEDTAPTNPEISTEFSLSCTGSATFAGIIDLTGFQGRNQQHSIRPPERGGSLELTAADMTLGGQILARGGDAGGSFQVWESSLGGLVNVGQSGAEGGVIRLAAAEAITFLDGGSIGVEGGRHSLGVNNTSPGPGGTVWMSSVHQTFAEEFDINGPSATFLQLSGAENLLAIQENEDTAGGGNNGLDSAESLPLFLELNPATWLVTPISLQGTITADDGGSLVVTVGTDNQTDIEDLFHFSVPAAMPEDLMLNLYLNSPDDVDLDLLVFASESLDLLGISANPEATESLENLRLPPGNYLVGVARFDENDPKVANYSLELSFPTPAR